MQIEQIDKARMDGLRELSITQNKVGEAKMALDKLQKATAEFITQREKEALEKIDELFKQSGEIVAQINKNFAETTQFANTVATFSGFLEEMYLKVMDMLSLLEEKNKAWEAKLNKRTEDLSVVESKLQEQARILEKEKQNIEVLNKKLDDKHKLLASRRASLEQAIKDFKQDGTIDNTAKL
jgi:chromosome segregation ATPase